MASGPPTNPSDDKPASDGSNADLDRDAFYDPLEDENAEDYELEPIDPVVIEHQQKMATRAVDEAAASLDVSALYAERDRMQELEDFTKDFKFQFGVKHMLMATAGLAILLSLAKIFSGFGALILVALVGLGGAHAYLAWKDRQRMARIQEKRDTIIAMNRGQRAGETTAAEAKEKLAQLEAQQSAAAAEESLLPKVDRPPLKIAFSIKEVLIAMTVAAIALGFLKFVGGTLGRDISAAILGLLSVTGLAVYAIGMEVPGVVVLGWWVVLLMYIVVSLVSAMVPAV